SLKSSKTATAPSLRRRAWEQAGGGQIPDDGLEIFSAGAPCRRWQGESHAQIATDENGWPTGAQTRERLRITMANIGKGRTSIGAAMALEKRHGTGGQGMRSGSRGDEGLGRRSCRHRHWLNHQGC